MARKRRTVRLVSIIESLQKRLGLVEESNSEMEQSQLQLDFIMKSMMVPLLAAVTRRMKEVSAVKI